MSKFLVEVPGTVVPGVRLLRPAVEAKSAPRTSVPQQMQQSLASSEQPDSVSLGQMYEKLRGQATEFINYNRLCPSQGSFRREPFGAGRKR